MPSASHYLTPPTEVRALGLAVTGVGRISGQRQARVGRTLAGYAGVLLTEGAGTLELHGRPGRHELRAGSFFWLPPGIAHTYGPGPEGWSEYWILFEGPAAARYEELGYLGGGCAAIDPADPDATRSRLAGLLSLAGRPESLAGHIQAAAELHALICAVGTARIAHTAPEPARRDVGRRALALFDRDAHRPIGIGEVAHELAVSRDTLATAVRELTGSTPTEYLTRLRLNRSKTLLADTDLPVFRVARDVGFPDPAYFTRVFTKYTGVSPTTFRRQQQS
ncbi:helix-turn-helix transcriptional regulator [Actinospica durhamensis]|uniref:Helix-turn-helix transcriptional regulator n=1 Tax=Actinospica durhamensis TaxID=1508375 RepID=A0A941EPT9_9ACTN|nr:AraC family transcriptional regulator [Actinospica durhamensis]MBR7835697.1 helix-turn-helix transcriptional regulator [Actinospica durhamensis]